MRSRGHDARTVGVAGAAVVTGPRIDVDLCVSTYSTLKSSSILGAYDIGTNGTVFLTT